MWPSVAWRCLRHFPPVSAAPGARPWPLGLYSDIHRKVDKQGQTLQGRYGTGLTDNPRNVLVIVAIPVLSSTPAVGAGQPVNAGLVGPGGLVEPGGAWWAGGMVGGSPMVETLGPLNGGMGVIWPGRPI